MNVSVSTCLLEVWNAGLMGKKDTYIEGDKDSVLMQENFYSSSLIFKHRNCNQRNKEKLWVLLCILRGYNMLIKTDKLWRLPNDSNIVSVTNEFHDIVKIVKILRASVSLSLKWRWY